jgi:hypothetical protein
VPLVQIGGDVHLGAQRCPVAVERWEERVRGGGGDDLHASRLLEVAKGPHEVPVVAAPRVAQRLEAIAVHARQAMVVRLRACPVDLVLRELDQPIEVARISLLQEIVREHRDERRRERDGAAEGNPVGDQALERLQERQIGARDAFVEPLLLHYRRIFGVTHEGEVSVQDERQVTGGHGRQRVPSSLPDACGLG